jgi:hypothetical protein
MPNVMLDLETYGTTPGCVVLSIGAVEFGRDGLKSSFYAAINRQSCLNAGLIEDPDTVAWWSRQSEEAKQTLRDSESKTASVSLGKAIGQLDFWLSQIVGCIDNAAGRKTLLIWGNGADFDPPILAAACRASGHDVPWPAHGGRCYRTLKNLRPDIHLTRSGLHHNALTDAHSQAEHAIRLIHAVGRWL